MRFEWDENKNLANIAKHDIDFAVTVEVFDTPDSQWVFDRWVDDEERWHVWGFIGYVLILVVVTERKDGDGNNVIRIISVRRANREERRDFARRTSTTPRGNIREVGGEN